MTVRPTRRTALRVVAAVVAVLALAEFAGLAHVAWQREAYPDLWSKRAAEPVPADAVRVVVLGDSTAMGIGAWHPEDSLVGRIVDHVERRTRRPVHVTNRSTGGGGVLDAHGSVVAAEVARADLVIVSVGSGDVGRTPPAQFRRQLGRLAQLLPAERTVFSGIPPRGNWRTYQGILDDLAVDRGFLCADVAAQFLRARRLDMFAPDLVHVNSTGYRLWFQAFRPHLDAITAELA